MTHTFDGICPICEYKTQFRAETPWYRDYLFCSQCHSIPRERAFAYCLKTFIPNWRAMVLHECSPEDRGSSARMRREAKQYIGSHFFADVPRGQMHKGYRSENLEALTFDDNSIDIHCHLDVLEHVNRPDLCFAEMHRTLRPGGHIIFTTPIIAGKLKTERKAKIDENGVTFFGDPEYHGNPIDADGSPVTFHYGSDLADLILSWMPGASVRMITLNDQGIGVLGAYREVFVVTTPGGAQPSLIRRLSMRLDRLRGNGMRKFLRQQKMKQMIRGKVGRPA